MNEPTENLTKAHRNSKLKGDGGVQPHSQANSHSRLAKPSEPSRKIVCNRRKNKCVRSNSKRSGVPRYEKVGSKHFRCGSCGKVKPLHHRHGTICNNCCYRRWVSTIEGALRFRFIQKKCRARRKGVQFSLTFECFRQLWEDQEGKDGYTGQQMAFEFGQGRSGATVSLDRIDNERGYTPDNVKFCRLSTNGKKKDQPVDQFVKQLTLNFPESN